MARPLVSLVVSALLLAGCGGTVVVDPESGSTTSPTPDAPSMSIGDPVQEPNVVTVLSEPGAGGRVSATPVPVGDPAALREFVVQFEGRLSRGVSQAAAGATVPDGQTLLASVVDISCNPPQDVNVVVRDGGVRIVPILNRSKGSDRTCYLAVTTVALVTAVV